MKRMFTPRRYRWPLSIDGEKENVIFGTKSTNREIKLRIYGVKKLGPRYFDLEKRGMPPAVS